MRSPLQRDGSTCTNLMLVAAVDLEDNGGQDIDERTRNIGDPDSARIIQMVLSKDYSI